MIRASTIFHADPTPPSQGLSHPPLSTSTDISKFSSPFGRYLGRTPELNLRLVKRPPTATMIGSSIEGFAMLNGDTLLNTKLGDIPMVLVGGEATVKRYESLDRRTYLGSGKDRYAPIPTSVTDFNCQVWGDMHPVIHEYPV